MARSRREKQVQEHLMKRQRSIERAVATEMLKAGRKSERWFRSGGRPRGSVPYFCYCTQPVQFDGGERGWLSWVDDWSQQRSLDTDMEALGAAIPGSVELHRTRKAAKARAWNLYQGWRHARGLSTRWGTFA